MVTTKEGFTIIQETKKDKEIFRRNGVYVMESYIPHTYTSSTLVYFVHGSNGDEYGQFPKRNLAIKKAIKMSKLSLDERRRYDE